MSMNIDREFQYQVKAADGTILWQGAASIGVDYRIKSVEASVTIPVETAVKADGTTTTLGQSYNPGTSDALALLLTGKAVNAATDVGFYGISMEPIAPGLVGFVAGMGSVCSVRVTSGAIAVGANIGGSATTLLCAGTTTNTTTNLSVGVCFKAAAQQGSTGTYYAGILVCPGK